VRDVAASLKNEYGIVADSIERHAGGFEADAPSSMDPGL